MFGDLLVRIEAFRPTPDDSWRELDELVAALARLAAQADDGRGPRSGGDLFPALPALLRVFERFPRHDGHGVFWAIIHLVESIRGYEALLIDHVTRAPTELGVTMLRRLEQSGIVRVGIVELGALIAELAPRAPLLDYTLDPQPIIRRPADALLAELAAFEPHAAEPDWSPLLALVAQLLDTNDPAIVTPLLRTLDRFHAWDGFAPFWPIVNGLEQLPGFPSALVASVQRTPTRYGTTLLLRLLARDVTTVDGIDLAMLAAEQLAREA